MKKLVISILIISILFSIMCISVRAESTTIEVGTQEEWAAALTQIHNDSNGNYIISVTDDIIIDSTTLFTSGSNIDNGNTVTILGNGHTLKFALDGNDKIGVSNATLNLGLSDGSNTLNIEGAGPNGASQSSLVSVYSGGILNMYEGVSLSNNYSGSRALSGCGVSVNSNATFNMYGGSIHDNATTTGGVGGAISVDPNSGTAVFNMYDGKIYNNYCVQWGGAIYVDNGNTVNITGGKIYNNESPYGGGISSVDGIIYVKNAAINGNNSSYGAGILNYQDGELTIENTTISNNISTSNGGGIMSWGKSCSIKNSIFEGNSAKNGAAIRNQTGTFYSENNVLKNNTASSYGGGIYSAINIESKNDNITKNTAKYAGGVYLGRGEADLSTTKVYNNKATSGGSDYLISPDTTNVKLMEAYLMDAEAKFGDETVTVNLWHKDEDDDRFSPSNQTEIVDINELNEDEWYALVAGNGGCKVLFDDDGKISTANVRRVFMQGGKIKLNANGGNIESDEINLTSDSITVENPTRAGYIFAGWTEEEVEGYELGLKANWKEEEAEDPQSEDEEPTSENEEENTTEEKTDEEDKEEEKTSVSGVATGDNIIKWVAVLGTAGIILLVTTIKLKKSKIEGKRFK